MRGLEGRVGWCKVSWRHEMVWLCWCKVRVWRGEGGSVCLRGGRRSGSLNSNSQTGVIVSVLIPGGPHSTNSILEKLRPHEFAQSITIFYHTIFYFYCSVTLNAWKLWGRNEQTSFLHILPPTSKGEEQSISWRPMKIEL